MTNFGFTGLSQTDTTRGPSDIIWRKPEVSVLLDPSYGVSFFDDFTCFSNVIAEAALSGVYASEQSTWTSYEDTGGTPATIATEHTGVLQLLTDATDNDELSLQRGSAVDNHCLISDTAGDEFLMAWEARINVSSITNATLGWFAGLAEEGSAATGFLGDAGAITDMADKDYLGFSVLEADGDALKVIVNLSGGTDTLVLTHGTAIVADTYYKLGMVFRPGNGTKTVTFYLDGKDLGTYIDDSTTSPGVGSTNFPDGQEMSTIFGIRNASAAAQNMEIDWVRFAQSHSSI